MDQISHIFNKASVRDISASEIKKKVSKMIDNLIGKLEESHIHWDLNSKLELDSDYQYHDPPRASKSSNSILHSAILNMKTFPHAKGTRYTLEQLEELREILQRFKNDHLTICRALNISRSTYNRIKKELKDSENQNYKSKRNSKGHRNISAVEQEYISKLVKPPTSPKSIASIRK